MIVFRWIPCRGFLDRRDDFARLILCGAIDRGFGFTLLITVQGEHRAAILCADIVALAVQLRRIMGGEKDVCQITIADDCGVISNPDCLGMARAARAYLTVCRVIDMPANIATFNAADAA